MTSFDDGDEVVVVGRRLPRLVSIAAMDDFHVAVTWETGTRPKDREIIDLAPFVARHKVYASLCDDPGLFRTVRLQEHRFGVAWGDGSIDMGASTIADIADEAMTAEDFTAFMERHGFTLDQAAAELGISRRMAAYYKREHKVPRTVALACRYIDLKARSVSNAVVADSLSLALGNPPYFNLHSRPMGQSLSVFTQPDVSSMLRNITVVEPELSSSKIRPGSFFDNGPEIMRLENKPPVGKLRMRQPKRSRAE